MGDLSADFALSLSARMLWIAMYVCAPVLGFSVVIGLLVSVLQAVTQVQEASLAFVVKLGTVAMTLLIFGPWMLAKVTEFSRVLIGNIPLYF